MESSSSARNPFIEPRMEVMERLCRKYLEEGDTEAAAQVINIWMMHYVEGDRSLPDPPESLTIEQIEAQGMIYPSQAQPWFESIIKSLNARKARGYHG